MEVELKNVYIETPNWYSKCMIVCKLYILNIAKFRVKINGLLSKL